MTKNNTRSVAVLTCNQDDVELVNSCISHETYSTSCLWISNPKQFVEALAKETIEIIVLNMDEYESTVRQVVKLKDTFISEVPVIVVSKKADEQSIVKIIKGGANDLVSIKRKARLRVVLNRELRALRVEKALNTTLISATEYHRQLQDYIENSTNGIAYVQDGIVTDVNKTWLQLFGKKSNQGIVRVPLTALFHEENHAAINGAIVAAAGGKWQTNELLTVQSIEKNRASATLELSFQPANFDGVAHVRVCISPTAVTQKKHKRLLYDALERDPTTHFFRREKFLNTISKKLRKKPKSGLYALVYIKPDDFSEVHQAVGILETEDVLAQFAVETRKCMCPRDIAGRFEGTVIMVLLQRGNKREAEVWGKQLVDHIRKHTFMVGEQTVRLTCTVGVVGATGTYSNLEELVSGVAKVHKQAKAAGGNRVALRESIGADARLKKYDRMWVKKIKASLAGNGFCLAQLPIAGLRRNSTEMYDMLIRMIDKEAKPIIPSEFLPAAERNNLMIDLDKWMIKSSMEFCTRYAAEKVFVRLSLQSMQDPSLVPWMRKKVVELNVDPSCLVIQIPEQSAAKYIKETKAKVEELRAIEVKFALEHYCVNTSRLHILDILRPDYIKIDGTLMHSLVTDAVLQESVRLLTCAAAERNIETIAERVENANAMAVLFQLGVHFMQGHYVHEPEVVLQESSSFANLLEASSTK